jgi:hypothetical protein
MSMDEAAFDPSSFPYRVVSVATPEALAERARLSAEGVAVIIGDDARAARVAQDIERRERTPRQLIEAAASIRFPDEWAQEKARRNEAAKALLEAHPPAMPRVLFNIVVEKDGWRDATPEEVADMQARGERGPDVGEWPETPEAMGFAAASGYPAPPTRLHIAILPTHDMTEAPAYLNFGDWNECPGPEHHVAALRAWRDRFGVSLVTSASDLLELTIARRPTLREAAIALAREHYEYCNDIIDQGFGDFAKLAASLTVSDWWSFWWD